MAIAPDNPSAREPRHVSIRLPRPMWFGLAAALFGLAYAGVYWQFFRVGPHYAIGDVKYSLDIERALVRARFQNKPVLLFFSAINSEGCRRMEETVLRATGTSRRFDELICAAVFVDQVPFVDPKIGKEMGDRNSNLQEKLFADVTVPAFAIVCPDFDLADVSDRRKVLAVSIGWVDGTGFRRCLDTALAEWDETRQLEMRGRDK